MVALRIAVEMKPEPVSSREADDAMLLAVGQGDQEAFQRFYDRFCGPVYSLLLELLGDRGEAEDLLLEGMEEIWRKADRFDPTRSGAFTWTVMLFRSRAIDRLRRRATRTRTLEKARDQSEVEVAGQRTDAGSELHEWREERELVRRAVQAMNDEPGQCLKMAFFEGRTHQEISEITGTPLGTVKSTIRRSLMQLRDDIKREGFGR